MSVLAVGTLNLLHVDDLLSERVEALRGELEQLDMRVLLLQEVTPRMLTVLRDLLPEWGFFSGTQLSGDGDLQVVATRDGDPTVWSSQPRDCGFTSAAVATRHGIWVSVHLAWGLDQERARQLQAVQLNRWLRHLRGRRPVFVGGDFNAEPASRTIRYLTGLDDVDGQCAGWTSAWTDREPFPTARTDGGWAEETARRQGIVRPANMPRRTIDHLLVDGWRYGRPGAFTDVFRFASSKTSSGRGISDHYGVGSHVLTDGI